METDGVTLEMVEFWSREKLITEYVLVASRCAAALQQLRQKPKPVLWLQRLDQTLQGKSKSEELIRAGVEHALKHKS